MKLLFDHNLSPRLVRRLADLYPDSTHVFLISLDRVSDILIWTYAHTNDYLIVTKDADFSDISVLRGFPPKVVWLRLGNSTHAIEAALRNRYEIIEAFARDPTTDILEVLA